MYYCPMCDHTLVNGHVYLCLEGQHTLGRICFYKKRIKGKEKGYNGPFRLFYLLTFLPAYLHVLI